MTGTITVTKTYQSMKKLLFNIIASLETDANIIWPDISQVTDSILQNKISPNLPILIFLNVKLY